MLVKILIVVVILACLGPFFIKGPDGEPLMTLDDLRPEAPELPSVAPAEPVTVYKWQDENGVWQFSTEPVDGVEAETMQLDGKVTTLDALTPEDYRRASGEPTRDRPASFEAPSGLMSVSPDKVQEMMDTVNTLQDTVDERKAEMDKVAGGG